MSPLARSVRPEMEGPFVHTSAIGLVAQLAVPLASVVIDRLERIAGDMFNFPGRKNELKDGAARRTSRRNN